MKRIALLFLGLILLGSFNEVYAQDRIVRGRIIEEGSEEPVIGATVAEIDENDRIINGTISDFNGNYALKLKNSGSRLKYSFIGYENIVETVGDRTTIDVELSSSSVALEDVVIVAQVTDPLSGTNQRDRATSTVKVDLDDISSISVTSAADALQGQVTGLDIMASGAPGTGAQIVIRGQSSLGDATPLIVIDGIAQDINTSGFDFGSADVEDFGALMSIAPQDIKSIDVLKDAASTAVWGSQGANGVLMITTNRGSKGKTKFDYNYKLTMDQAPPAIPMLDGNEYSMLMLEAMHNREGVFDIPDEIAYDPDYYDFYNYSANTDWVGEITQTGITHDHFFKLGGGGDKTSYYASLNAVNEVGTTVNEGFKRLTTRINLDYALSKKIRFSVNFDYTNSYQDGNWYYGSGWSKITVRRMAYMKAPNMSIYEYDENGVPTGEYFKPIQSFQGDGGRYFNPVAIAALSDRDIKSNKFQNSFVLRYRISPKLSFNETISFQYQGNKLNEYLPYSAIGTDWLDSEVNSASEKNYNNRKLSSRSLLVYTPISTDFHVLDGRLMVQVDQYSYQESQLDVRNGPSVSIIDPAVSAPVASQKSGSSEVRALGTLFSLNYKILDRYIMSAILRADANSKFGANNRWGYFPSLSFAWRFSSEPFLRDFTRLNEGKLRVAYGQAGKQPNDAYARHGIFNTSWPSQYIEKTVVIPTQVQLTNLRWQTIESFNLGIDLSMLRNRLYVTGEIYSKVTHDLLWKNYEIPGSSGFSTLRWYNGGMVKNVGWETYMRYNIIKGKERNLGINFNLSRNQNSFLEFPENFNNIKGESVDNGVFPRQANIDQPIGSFYGFIYQGVYPTDADAYATDSLGVVRVDSNGDPIPMTFTDGTVFQAGDAKYKDVNYDGVIDINDAQYLGDSNPDMIGGFGMNGSYKNFRISCQFMFRIGFEIVNEIAMDTEGMLNRNNQSKAVLHRWRREGQGVDNPNMLPRAYYLHPANNLGSNRYVEAGDFLRLNNVTLGYSIRNNAFTKRMNVDALEISFNFRKILTFTNYSGQDPEISQRMEDPFWFGTDNGLTPTPRKYSMTLNVRF